MYRKRPIKETNSMDASHMNATAEQIGPDTFGCCTHM